MPKIRVLVIGGSGFLGQSLVLSLSEAGIPFSYTYKNCSRGTTLVFCDHAFHLDIDTSDFSFLYNGDFTHVISLLPIANSFPLIHATLSHPSIKFIFLSTTAIYSGFASPHRATRIRAEKLLLRLSPSCIIIRPTMIVGSLDHDFIGKLILRFSSNGLGILPRPLFGSCIFQPIDVYDLSRLIASYILVPLPSCALPHVCDIGGAEPISFVRYFQIASEVFHFNLIIVPFPFCILLPILNLLGLLGLRKCAYMHEKLFRLQEAKIVSNRIHHLIDYVSSPYWASLSQLRNDYFLNLFSS